MMRKKVVLKVDDQSMSKAMKKIANLALPRPHFDIIRSMMRKVVQLLLKVDARSRGKAMQKIAGVAGVISIAMDMESKKMTVVGDDLDTVKIVSILRKYGDSEIFSVGPAVTPAGKRENNDYDMQGGGGGGGGGRGSGGGGDGGDGDGDGDGDGGNNNGDQDPFNQSGGQSGSLFYNLTDYNNWRRNARVQQQMLVALLSLLFEFQRKLSFSLDENYLRGCRSETHQNIDPRIQMGGFPINESLLGN